ncbi:hypothetical protein PVAP13_9KG069000 [Panicum virgatum]|uniref:Uncharacterized protein n=1 Tax=Panicum virgatum TaxID=38727 RepID=A0A8T0NEE3_PANVG|nr:hypothetical protein PVAP13_9KG069000 [Panicum virgatum]
MMSFKGHEGLGQVAAGSQASHVAAGAPLPWWAGPQLIYGEPAPLSPEETRRDGHFQVVPGAQGGTPDPAPPAATKRGNPEVLKFSVFQGNLESGGKGDKNPEHSTTIALQSPFPEYNGRFEIGLGQSMVPSNYSCDDQCYGVLTTYGMRSMSGGRMLLPLNAPADAPIYVNPKAVTAATRAASPGAASPACPAPRCRASTTTMRAATSTAAWSRTSGRRPSSPRCRPSWTATTAGLLPSPPSSGQPATAAASSSRREPRRG